MIRKLVFLVVLALTLGLVSANSAYAAKPLSTITITADGDCESLTTTVVWQNVPKTVMIEHQISPTPSSADPEATGSIDDLGKSTKSGTSVMSWPSEDRSKARYVRAYLWGRGWKGLAGSEWIDISSLCPS